MEKFSGLYIKSNGEWQIHGKLDSDVDGKIEMLKKITDNNGKVGRGQKAFQAERAYVIHSTKGILKTRVFK